MAISDLLYSPPISRPIRELLLSSYPIRNGGEYWLHSNVSRNLIVSNESNNHWYKSKRLSCWPCICIIYIVCPILHLNTHYMAFQYIDVQITLHCTVPEKYLKIEKKITLKYESRFAIDRVKPWLWKWVNRDSDP